MSCMISADATWTILHTVNSSRGVTLRTQAVFSSNPNVDWLPPARRVYAMLRTGTCAQALAPGAWGLTSVQQVVFPYLVTSVRGLWRTIKEWHGLVLLLSPNTLRCAVQGSGHNSYVPGTMVHGLNINLLLRARNMDWLTLPRAEDLTKPLQAMSGAPLGI